MRRALIDFDVSLFGRHEDSVWARDLGATFDAMAVAGLNVVGRAPTPIEMFGRVVRLIVEADVTRPDALPEECETEWRIVCPLFTLERHGAQRIVKMTELQVGARPRLQLAA